MKNAVATASAPAPWGAWPAVPPFSAPANNLLAVGSTYLEAVTEFNQECAKFVSTRLEHDADLGRELSQCKDWDEVMRVQQAWFTKASEEYLAETQQLMALGNQVLSAGLNDETAKKGQDAPE